MKQLLFLLLFPCLAMAQYTGNGNQKITLGEQTTADGLVYRGVANIDTVTATSKITRANKQDTSAFILLDTVTNLLWHYKTASNGWIQAGGGVSVSSFSAGTTGLTPSTATTGAVTLGGTLAVANGGTNITTFTAANRIPYASSATALTTSSNLTYNNSTLVVGNENDNYDNLSLKNKATTSNTNRRAGLTANTYEGDSLVGIMSVFAGASDRSLVFGGGVSNLKNPTDITFYTSTNVENPADRGSRHRMFINDIGDIGMGTLSPSQRLHVVGNARITGAYSATTGSAANVFVTTDGVLQRSTSSIKYKTDVEDYSKGLKEVMQLRPVTFKSINSNNDKTYAGFIAEELADLKLNELVENNDSGEPDAISYAYMVTLLTKAIQEQQEQISLLKKRLLILENK